MDATGYSTTDTINALVQKLNAMQRPGGGRLFGKVTAAINEINTSTINTPPVAIVTADSRVTWDGQNPDCGRQQLYVMLLVRDQATPRGEFALTMDGQLLALQDQIRDELGWQTGGPWQAGTMVTGASQPTQGRTADGKGIWTLTMTFEVIRG